MTLTCEQASRLLSAFVDRELVAAQSVDMEAHVHACVRCSTVVERDLALRAAMQTAPLRFAAPVGIEGRIRKHLRCETDASRRLAPMIWRWATVPLAMAAAAVITWGVAARHGTIAGQDPLIAELVSSHIRSLMVEHLVDVVSSDQHTVKPWFSGKVDFSPPVQDFSAAGFPLIGGRVDYVGGRPVAVIVYKRRLHAINVFIWPSAYESGEGSRYLVRQGYRLRLWTHGGLTFWAVSDVNDADLDTLVQLFAQAG